MIANMKIGIFITFCSCAPLPSRLCGTVFQLTSISLSTNRLYERQSWRKERNIKATAWTVQLTKRKHVDGKTWYRWRILRTHSYGVIRGVGSSSSRPGCKRLLHVAIGGADFDNWLKRDEKPRCILVHVGGSNYFQSITRCPHAMVTCTNQ